MTGIDFGSFSRGASAAKQDYWDDIRNSQNALIRDTQVQDSLREAQNKTIEDQAAAYLSPMLMDAQAAAAQGKDLGEWFKTALPAIMSDQGFQTRDPLLQRSILEKMRQNGVMIAQKMKDAGDETGALGLYDALGMQFGPRNRANINNMYDSYDLAGAGFKLDPATGELFDPQGNLVSSARVMDTLNRGGQSSLNTLLTQLEAERRVDMQGVAAGLYKPDGRGGFIPTTTAEREERIGQEQFDSMTRQIERDRQNGLVDFNNAESVKAYQALYPDRSLHLRRLMAGGGAPAATAPVRPNPSYDTMPYEGDPLSTQPILPSSSPYMQLLREVGSDPIGNPAGAAANAQYFTPTNATLAQGGAFAPVSQQPDLNQLLKVLQQGGGQNPAMQRLLQLMNDPAVNAAMKQAYSRQEVR